MEPPATWTFIYGTQSSANTSLVAEDYQTGQAGHDPLELVTHELVEGRLYEIVVVHRSGRVPDWVQVVARGPVNIEHLTENGSINNPSESANRGMLAVGATHYWDTHTIADYSSRGPTPDGRVKPDIVGTACGETASYEPRPPEFYDGNSCWFPGTSQAAPHIAGLAALVRQRFSDYSAEKTAAYLKDHAEPRGTINNNTWGHGFAVLPPIGGCSNNPGPGGRLRYAAGGAGHSGRDRDAKLVGQRSNHDLGWSHPGRLALAGHQITSLR